jgi:hypothetical protein
VIWYSFGRTGLDFRREEWERLMEGPKDLDNLTALGIVVYRECVATAALDPDPDLDGAIEAVAHVLFHMAESPDDELWTDLSFFLQQRWRFDEQAFWESPDMFMMANADAERSERRNVLSELMLVGHGLRDRIRPAIFRLAWCMMMSSDRRRSMGSIEAIDAGRTLLVPTTFLEDLVAERAPDFFDEKESLGMRTLLMYLRLREAGSIADEVMASIVSRTFWLVHGGAVMDLYLHSEEGTRIEEERVAAWRRATTHLAACMCAFNVMLVGTVTAAGMYVGPERFEDREGEEPKKQQPSLTAASP